MYFKLEFRTIISLDFLFDLAIQLWKHMWILQVGERMKCMSNLSDKFMLGRTLFVQIILSFLAEKYKYLSLTVS